MQNLPEQVILQIALYDESVWDSLRATCKRLASVLDYRIPQWEDRFLYMIKRPCHYEYRLKSTNRLHRHGGKPAVVAKNCKCNFDVKYFRGNGFTVSKYSGIKLLGGVNTTIYAKRGYMSLLESSNDHISIVLRSTKDGIVVNHKTIYAEGRRACIWRSAEILDLENEYGLVTTKYSRRRPLGCSPRWWERVSGLNACIMLLQFLGGYYD